MTKAGSVGTSHEPDALRLFASGFGVLPGFALAGAAELGLVPRPVALALFALSFVGLNLVHMASTSSRVYLERGYARAAPWARLVVPFGLMFAALWLEAVGFAVALLTVQYVLSLHHAVMQNYGVVRHAQAGGGLPSPRDRLVTLGTCAALPLAALLLRPTVANATYNGIDLPQAPLVLPALFGAAGLVATVLYVRGAIEASRRGTPVPAVALSTALVPSLVWSFMLLVLRDPAFPLYALASGHYLQYIHFVWRHEHRNEALSLLPASVRTAAGPRRPLQYLVLLTAFGGAGVLALTALSLGLRAVATAYGWRTGAEPLLEPWAAAMLGVNLHHYWLDHVIWRRPRAVAAAA